VDIIITFMFVTPKGSTAEHAVHPEHKYTTTTNNNNNNMLAYKAPVCQRTSEAPVLQKCSKNIKAHKWEKYVQVLSKVNILINNHPSISQAKTLHLENVLGCHYLITYKLCMNYIIYYW